MKLHTDEIGMADLPVGQHDIEMAVLAFLHGAVSHQLLEVTERVCGANLMTLALACGGRGVANQGFFSEVCGDDADTCLYRLNSGEEPPDGP